MINRHAGILFIPQNASMPGCMRMIPRHTFPKRFVTDLRNSPLEESFRCASRNRLIGRQFADMSKPVHTVEKATLCYGFIAISESLARPLARQYSPRTAYAVPR